MGLRRIRKYLNSHFIENNPDLVEAMIYYNKIHGRRENGFSRMCLSIQLYIRYGIGNVKLQQEKLKGIQKATYPESKQNQKVQLQRIKEAIIHNDTIICDAFSVLFVTKYDTQQILALVESKSGQIGLSDMPNEALQKYQSSIEDIALDCISINKEIKDLLIKAQIDGKNVFVYCPASIPQMFMQRLLWKEKCNFHIIQETGEGVHITNHAVKPNDIMYKDVNCIGDAYRPFCYTNIVTSMYEQIVNLQFHSSEQEYSLFYEYGFTCGGILTCGFCQYLDGLAQQGKIDKFLFVARDGDIMKQIYEQYFHTVESAYLVFSRFASFELIFEDFPEEYLDKNVKARINRINTDNSIRKILHECGIGVIEPYLAEQNLKPNEILTTHNYAQLREVILNHKKEMQKCFQESCDAAKQYIMEQIQGKKKVCIVDLGWNGKSIVYLKHLCEKQYGWNGKISGAMIGAVTSPLVQSRIRTGLVQIYAFENECWRTTAEYKKCICVEELFSSPSDTLLRYKLMSDGSTDFIYGKKNKNKKTIEQIHQGIRDFAAQFIPFIQKYDLLITPEDAYTPVNAAMHNEKYVEMLYGKYDEEVGAINGF